MVNGHDSATTLSGRNLTHCFGEGDLKTTVLHDVSIDLCTGQVALLMGPSGSGKSTLMAILSGLLRPNGGQVTAISEDIWAMSERERADFRLKHMGFIFQGANLFAGLTARQNLELMLQWGEGAGAADARRRADEVLSMLGLAKKAHLRPIELSGGEKQRVAIGRALIKEPTLVFADEPTSALDRTQGEVVVRLLRNAARERHATILVVAHDERLIPYVDQVFYLSDGCSI